MEVEQPWGTEGGSRELCYRDRRLLWEFRVSDAEISCSLLPILCFLSVIKMRKSFKDSIKILEADIQHANTLSSDFPREFDGACLQMRISYSAAAHLFLFLMQWTDCHFAGALGLLRILIYKVYVDGTTTMSTHERKASIREFYAVIYPSLLQLQKGVTEIEEKQQKSLCIEKYKRRDNDDSNRRGCLELEPDRDEECGICMEANMKIVLPDCNHVLCLKCYSDWYPLLYIPFVSYTVLA